MDNTCPERKFSIMLEQNEFEMLKNELTGDDADVKINGFPYELFDKLSDGQKKDMFVFLMANISKADWRIFAGLGELRNKGAEEILVRKLDESKQRNNVMATIHLALSLWKISKYHESTDLIIDIVKKDNNCFEAIKALGSFDDKKTMSLLLDLLQSDYSLVRSFAVQAILKRIGHEDDPYEKSHPWRIRIISKNNIDVSICKQEIQDFLEDNDYI